MITDQKSIAKIVGVYIIGNINSASHIEFGLPLKPNFFRRLCTWLFLGWKYYSIESLKKIKNGN